MSLRALSLIVCALLSTTSSIAAAARAPAFHHATAATHDPATVRRIVSLSPMVTETLFALGAGARVVGVTRYCDRPQQATALPKVGGYTDVSLEAVLALSPQLVIAQRGEGQWAVLDRLQERGIDVFLVVNDTLDESQRSTVALADVAANGIVGARQAATDLVAAQNKALQAAAGSGTGLRVVVVVGTGPLVVAGAGSFAERAVAATGATSVIAASDPAWPLWSLETMLARKVDVVVVADGTAGVAAVTRALAPLGRRMPRIVAAERNILTRAGPGFAADVDTLATLLRTPARPTTTTP